MTSNKTPASTEQILNSAEFKQLIVERRKLSLPVVFTITVAYFAFILMIAFDPAVLGQTIGGGKVSIGIYLGLGLLLLSLFLTYLYLRLSNGKVAELQQAVRNKFQ